MSGARMIPNIYENNTPPGERKVFDLLKKDMGATGWVVLHSLDLAKHTINISGEADFVVLIPNEGIVIIEVKSHKAVKYDGYGWHLGHDPVDIRGPFKQASQAMHSIRNVIDKRSRDYMKIPYISCVIFTEVDFTVRSPEWHEWQVVDRSKLGTLSISKILREIILKARILYSEKQLPWAKGEVYFVPQVVEEVSKIMRPFFEAFILPRQEIKNESKRIVECTEQQYLALDYLGVNPRVFFQGSAGTGKTCLAIEAIRRDCIANPMGRRALFCFNRNLADIIQQHFNIEGIDCIADTFSGWQCSYVKLTPPNEDKNEFWKNTVPRAVIEKVAESGKPVFDFIVIDEAQDIFTENNLEVLNWILDKELTAGRWVFFADFENQSIQMRGRILSINDFKQRFRVAYAEGSLTINCRNPKEVVSLIQLISPPTPGYTKILRDDEHNDPEYCFYETKEQQQAIVAKLLTTLCTQGYSASDIVILSPNAKESSCAFRLAMLNLWKSRIKPYSINERNIRYTSIHSFKGLESSIVILTDIEGDLDSLKKSILYVGMSRTLHRLFIVADKSFANYLRKVL